MKYLSKKNVCNIDVEYAQWQLTRNLLNHMVTKYSQYKSSVYEFHNIIERLLMSMCNSTLKSRLCGPWTVYYYITRVDPFIKQMHVELVQKCGVGKYAIDIVEYIVNAINTFVSNDVPTYDTKGVVKIYKTRLSYRSFNIELHALQIAKLKRFNKHMMLAMIIRYCIIIIKSQQWSIPNGLFKVLYQKYNVRFEAFASPLNNGLKVHKNTKYCSLFDIDKNFESIGNIFDINMSSPISDVKLNNVGWIAHPPYIPSIMSATFDKIKEGLDSAQLRGVKMFVILIVPYWPDSEMYMKIKRTHHHYTEIVMTRHTHFYENHGRYINSSFDTSIFIFSENTSNNFQYADIIDAIYIKNIPCQINIPKIMKLCIRNSEYEQIILSDNDDNTNKVVMNTLSTNRTTWKLKYSGLNNNYVIKNKDISPLVVKIT